VPDPFGVSRLEVDRHAEGDRGQDRQLVGGVNAVDIERRIGFGVAQLLRLAQNSRDEDRYAPAVPVRSPRWCIQCKHVAPVTEG